MPSTLHHYLFRVFSFWHVLFLEYALFGMCHLGMCPFWNVPILECALYGMSPFWNVPTLECALYGMSPFWNVPYLTDLVTEL